MAFYYVLYKRVFQFFILDSPSAEQSETPVPGDAYFQFFILDSENAVVIYLFSGSSDAFNSLYWIPTLEELLKKIREDLDTFNSLYWILHWDINDLYVVIYQCLSILYIGFCVKRDMIVRAGIFTFNSLYWIPGILLCGDL